MHLIALYLKGEVLILASNNGYSSVLDVDTSILGVLLSKVSILHPNHCEHIALVELGLGCVVSWMFMMNLDR